MEPALSNSNDLAVIVPVYNGFAHVESCLTALRPTATAGTRILLIDDASPDPRIVPLLAAFAADFPNGVEVIQRSVNGGFIHTVNDGIRAAGTADCLILNSDTEPVGRWIEGMREVLERELRVGVVFPTSNNATIYSVGELEAFRTVAGDEVIERCMWEAFGGRSLDVPTGAGFCMYLRRAMLDAVGLLNPIFGMGYGEENDLCQRARKAGFTIRWALGALVFHSGGGSMVDAGVRGLALSTIPENEEILRELHPTYGDDIDDPAFRRRVELVRDDIRERMLDAVLRATPPAVHICHLRPRPESMGGIERHVRDLIAAQAARRPVAVVYADGFSIAADLHIGGYQRTFRTTVPAEALGTFRSCGTSERVASLVADVLHGRIAHIHHLIGFAFDLPRVLADAGVKTVFTVHDYYLASPNVTLHGDGGDPDVPQWFEGFFGSVRWTSSDWTAAGRDALKAMSAVIAPTTTARDQLLLALRLDPADATHVMVRCHAHAKRTGGPSGASLRSERPRALFLGSSQRPEKGRATVEEIVPLLLEGGLEVHFLGARRDHFAGSPWALDRRVVFHGYYAADMVVTHIRRIAPAVGILVSPWHETFGYTLSELRTAGVPCVVGPLGGVAERVRHAGDGVVADGAPAIADAVLALVADPARHGELARRSLDANAAGESVATYAEAVDELLRTCPTPVDTRPQIPPLTALLATGGVAGPVQRSLRKVAKDKVWPYIPTAALPWLVRAKRWSSHVKRR